MDLGLQGKVAIVTGGSKGIGRATALALAQEGVDVAICARGVEELEDAASDIRARTGQRALAVRADTGEPDDIKNLVARTAAELGGVDILINNAVNSTAARFMELADEDWLNHINVKIMGYVRCARECIPHMQQRGGGRIINIGGMAARHSNPLTNSNGVTNASVSNMAKNLADQVAGDGILVNCIHPGTTRTPRQTMLLERQARDSGITVEEAESRAVSRIPIGRMVEPEDIADLVLFLVSNRAGAITGQSIGVEGGAVGAINY
jgi:NAD(P)-dependent dehydrogenase (short-subunit alcohol dehydrogenase family)